MVFSFYKNVKKQYVECLISPTTGLIAIYFIYNIRQILHNKPNFYLERVSGAFFME